MLELHDLIHLDSNSIADRYEYSAHAVACLWL